jgi:hypothetical protein
MAKSAAERMRDYRNRQRNENVTSVTKSDRNRPTVTGPLDVYSERRWSFLQGRGYEWYPDRLGEVKCGVAIKNLGERGQLFGVTVPGDPGYRGIA